MRRHRFYLGVGLAALVVLTGRADVSAQLDKAALLCTIPWDTDWVTAVTFAGPTRKLAAGNKLGQILVWDLPGKAGPVPPPALRLDGHTNMVTALAATPDGRWLISTSYDHSVRLWDLQQSPKRTATAVLQGASGKKKEAAKVKEYRVGVLEAAKVLTAHQEWVRTLSLSRDGKYLLTGDDRGLAVLWSLPDGAEVRRLEGRGWLQAVALSPDATQAVTCAYAPRYAQFPNAIRLWDARAGKETRDLGPAFKQRGSQGVTGMAAAAFANDGKAIALGRGGEADTNGGKIFLVGADGKKLRELPGHMYGITGLAFHPDGKHLASCGRDTVARLWNVADGRLVQEIGKARGGQFRDWIHAVSFSADGRLLAAADMNGMVHVWSLAPKQ